MANTLVNTPFQKALGHIRVLDLTRILAGPWCGQNLADLGADVIKIERPDTGDDTRSWGPPYLRDANGVDTTEAAYYLAANRGKRSVTLDIATAEGQAIIRDLVKHCDVVLENYKVGQLKKYGLDYESLRRDKPDLIYCSITGFGQDGPYAERAGFDQIAQGMGGLMSITGEPGRGPMRVGIPIADLTSGLLLAQAIMLALYNRERTGKGDWVHTSLLEAQIFMLDFQAARWLMNGEVPKQAGNNHPTSIPTGVFKARDGYLNLAVAGHRIWVRFCNAIGAPELATHPDYATGALRSQNRDLLHGDIEAHLQKRDAAEWVELLNEAGVPSGPIYSIDQAFADPQVRHLGIAAKLDNIAYLGQPVTLSRTPSSVAAHPPALGEHTDEVLREIGYDDAAIERLKGQGIV